MSIAQQITRIRNNISAAYDELDSRGAEMPETRNSANLRNTVGSLPQIGDKMNRMQSVSSNEELGLLRNGQLFKKQGEIGVTDSSSDDNYVLFAKKGDLANLATKTELAAVVQNGLPEFVNQLSDCTDTSKLYVLPDGYIYAYTNVTVQVPGYTNLVPTSTVSGGGAVYNSVGYKNGVYVSGANDGTDADYASTGYIAYAVPSNGLPPTLYIKGAEWQSTSHTRLSFYTDSYGFLSTVNCTGSGGFGGRFTKEDLDTNYFRLIPTASGNSSALYNTEHNIAFIRFSFEGVGENLIISTSPIENTTSTQTTTDWVNTGLAFTPADYENRIIALENAQTALNSRFSIIENSSSSAQAPNIPSFVTAEAERAAAAVLSHQNADTVSFLAFSDAHYSDDSTDIVNAVAHAGQGMDQIRKRIHIDFGAVLGDNGWQAQSTTLSEGISQIRATNRLIDESLRGIPNFRMPGNHCSQIGSFYTNSDYHRNKDLYPLYGAYNTGAVFDPANRRRGYCYRDFEDRKLRVITLNTSDLEDSNPADLETHNISAAQLGFLVSALDVSAKTDAASWQILILGHAPLDWCDRTIPAAKILKAYSAGEAGSVTKDGTTVSYDFSAVTRGRIIAQIHGHCHGFKVDYLRCLNAGNSTEATTIKRISVPNACFSRNNQYNNGGYEYQDIEFGDDTTYNKTAGTANDTSFCIFTIDLQSRKIYADRYGAGIDREINY